MINNHAVDHRFTYQSFAAFARKVIALAIFPIKNFLRIRTLRAITYTALAVTMAATNFTGLVVRPAVSHSSRILGTGFVSFALTLLPVKAFVAGTHTANQSTVPSAIVRSCHVSLHFHQKRVRED